jgi:three-Cys-motif partner protein
MTNQIIKEPIGTWGGDWTKKKIEILVEYAQAYLKIMNKYRYWKLLYFDGFAGTGIIISDTETDLDITIGAARRILEIDKPRPFDHYYFVEKDKTNSELLKANTREVFIHKKIIVVNEDCNVKLKELAKFLHSTKGKNFKALAYIDPYGMQLEWASLVELSGVGVDIWILAPTGMGVNRLLKRNGEISESWLERLVKFLGMNEDEIKKYFYKLEKDETLFGEEIHFRKEKDAIEKAGILYQARLKTIFQFVSEPFILRSRQGNIMYHMFLASNNTTAAKIANYIVKKYNEMD